MSTIQHRTEIDPLRPYVPGRPIDDVKREYGLKEVIKLASNENPYGCSPKAQQAVIDTLSGPNAALYPDGACTVLREALAKKFSVATDRLIFGCGTDEIISMIGKVFINKNDEAITAAVSFSQYAASVNSMGGTMVYSPMKDHGFDLPDILTKITDKTKVIFIANPNNPTGTTHTAAEQAAFMEQVPSNVLVAFDEAYGEFVDEPRLVAEQTPLCCSPMRPDFPDTAAMLDKYPNILYMKTFSKAYGLASLRVGYAIGSPAIITLFEKIRNPFNVSVQAQAAAVAALADTDFLAESVAGNRAVRDYLYEECKALGLFYIPTQTNFVMIDIQKDSAQAFLDLMKKGYIIRPGAAFGMPTFLRVTLGTMEQMQGFVAVLKTIL